MDWINCVGEKEDHFRDCCGVFGVWNHPEAGRITVLGLHGLQHRGQEAAGVVLRETTGLREIKGEGLVADVFPERVLQGFSGRAALGHVRYSTTGESSARNAQPLTLSSQHGTIAIAHNGNLVNAAEVRRELEAEGSIFHTSVDTEIIGHLYARSAAQTLEGRLREILPKLRGAYSLGLLTEAALIAVRDPFGIRPLVLGRLGEAWVISSETCAFPALGVEWVREIEPGEGVLISDAGVAPFRFASSESKFCVFEYIYFSKPSSAHAGINVYLSRIRLGEELARECPATADLVIPVPDSGTPAALGYSRQSQIPFEMGLIRSHYVGRTFIQPSQSVRDFGVRLKHAPVQELIQGKRLVVVDDSVVRGTTTRKINQMLRDAGAREIHVRVSAPPTRGPCHYGIDTPSESELIANRLSLEEIRKYIVADSIGYLSVEGMYRAIGRAATESCDACFTHRYPIPVPRAAG